MHTRETIGMSKKKVFIVSERERERDTTLYVFQTSAVSTDDEDFNALFKRYADQVCFFSSYFES